jgi:hypothetical protein
MVPYDDLVVALAAWRARQGLPVAQVAGAVPGRPPGPPATARTAPPNAPPRSFALPAPIAADDFGADALVEDSVYDPAGEDYVMPLGGAIIVESAEATPIGGPPEPVTEGLLVPKRGKRKPDW